MKILLQFFEASSGCISRVSNNICYLNLYHEMNFISYDYHEYIVHQNDVNAFCV